MVITLDLWSFRKKVEIDKAQYEKGEINIALHPSLDNICAEQGKNFDLEVRTVTFYRDYNDGVWRA